MKNLAAQKTPDYVVIGHVTQDLTPQGKIPGGTALYAGWTAHALGLNVGFYTSVSENTTMSFPPGSSDLNEGTAKTTTFENLQTAAGRMQYIYHKASCLNPERLPASWKEAPIMHLGPVADEIETSNLDVSAQTLLCVTLQGWLRQWDENGRISFKPLQVSESTLNRVDLAVLSIEDVQYNEEAIETLASLFNVLAVTEGPLGCRVYWHGDLRRIPAQKVDEVDSTGAGDIFAAAFFYRYYNTRDPWEAARFANNLAATSVIRIGLESIPTKDEIKDNLVEIIKSK